MCSLYFIIVLTFWLCDKLYLSYASQEIEEIGSSQYKLLKERGNLPKHGACWKAGIEHLEYECKYLTDNVQSEIALHLTNCFLAMSGHDTYNCETDKKPNLRAICINNMSDRAFMVYTEYYTHVQNICSFLQEHIWHEMIAENTMVVGKKLQETARNQEDLLESQKESLKLQEKMLQHGKVLEYVLEDLFMTFKSHQDILSVLSETVINLQSWIVGEISWLDSIIFYTVSIIIIFIFTASQRTNSARLLVFFILLINFFIERLICKIYSFFFTDDVANMHLHINRYIWCSRYVVMTFICLVFVYFLCRQIDPFKKQNDILFLIQEQNYTIINMLSKMTSSYDKDYLNNVNENIKNIENSVRNGKESKNMSNQITQGVNSNRYLASGHTSDTGENIRFTKVYNKIRNIQNEQGERYNLRSNRSVSREPSVAPIANNK